MSQVTVDSAELARLQALAARAESGDTGYRVALRRVPPANKAGKPNRSAGDYMLSAGSFRTSVGVNLGAATPTVQGVTDGLAVLAHNVDKLAACVASADPATLIAAASLPATNGRSLVGALRK